MKLFKPSTTTTKPKNREPIHLQNVKDEKISRHLVVDDAATNRDLLKLCLESKALVVDTAENGKIALAKVQEHGVSGYDVVWTDLKMEGMSGIQLAEELRKIGFKKYVVVLTGNITTEDRAVCEVAGVDLVCLKPLRKKTLLDLPVMHLY